MRFCIEKNMIQTKSDAILIAIKYHRHPFLGFFTISQISDVKILKEELRQL